MSNLCSYKSLTVGHLLWAKTWSLGTGVPIQAIDDLFGKYMYLLQIIKERFVAAGADLGGGCRGCAPPPP